MFGHKRANVWAAAGVIAVGGFATTGPVEAAADRKEPAHRSALPELSSADQTYLIQLIRKSLAAVAAGRTPAKLGDPPDAVATPRCPVYVTLRRGGYLIALGEADGQQNLAESCRIAALSAAKRARSGARLTDAILKRLGVEVELLGPAEKLPTNSSNLKALTRQYRPGLEGVAVRLGGRSALILPSQIIASGFGMDDAIVFVERRLGLTPDAASESTEKPAYLRFQTRHFWQPDSKAPVVELQSGCALVKPDQVTADRLDESIRQIARYLQARQRDDGLFRHAYEPWSDRDEDSGPAIAQAGAAWALALYGASSRDAAAKAAAARVIDALAKQLVPCDDSGNRVEKGGAVRPKDGGGRNSPAYLGSPQHADRLGATAMLLLAASEISPAKTYRPLRRRLAAAILTCQNPTGMMRTNFATTRQAAPQDIDPGQAMLAVARAYALDRGPDLLAAVKNGLGHYDKQFDIKPTVAMVPWFAAAHAQIAARDGDRRHAEIAFGMVDRLGRRQLTASTYDAAIMHGGIDPLGRGLAGITTALHMATVADALSLARELGDKQRAARYERMLRAGTRFVLQLQFRPEECYYVRSRLETIHGVRATPWDHLLTIENCQHALIALIKARALLFH